VAQGEGTAAGRLRACRGDAHPRRHARRKVVGEDVADGVPEDGPAGCTANARRRGALPAPLSPASD
jgi:hypothetical protein